jgi:hypothetical protein
VASLKKVILNREDATPQQEAGRADAKILEVEIENLADSSACPVFSSRSLVPFRGSRLGGESLVFSVEPFVAFVSKDGKISVLVRLGQTVTNCSGSLKGHEPCPIHS